MLDVQLLENGALNILSEFALLMPEKRWLLIATDKTARISLEQGTQRRSKKGRQPIMFNTSAFTIKSIKVFNEPMIAADERFALCFLCLWNSDGGTEKKKETHIHLLSPTLMHPHMLPVDVRYPWSAGSAAMGVQLSVREASRPTSVSKNSSGCCAAQPFQVHVEVRKKEKEGGKKSNVSAIFSNDQSHLPENACEVIFHPVFLPFFSFHSSITGRHQ